MTTTTNTATPAVSAEHLNIPQAEIIDMILRAARRADANTNRIVVEEAHEQNAYWTLVLVEILRGQGYAHPGFDAAQLVANAAALRTF